MKINIEKVSVGLNLFADQVEFQILSFNLEPTEGIKANARFFDSTNDQEISNVPYDISQEIYNNWGAKDSYIIEQSLIILNLTPVKNGKANKGK